MGIRVEEARVRDRVIVLVIVPGGQYQYERNLKGQVIQASIRQLRPIDLARLYDDFLFTRKPIARSQAEGLVAALQRRVG